MLRIRSAYRFATKEELVNPGYGGCIEEDAEAVEPPSPLLTDGYSANALKFSDADKPDIPTLRYLEKCMSGVKHDNGKVYSHYFKRVPQDAEQIDVYDVLTMFDVTCPATAHAVKKLLCAGSRGHKDRAKDLNEARDSISRAIELTNYEDE